MKLSLLSITTGIASFVAATPFLAPRADPDPFMLTVLNADNFYIPNLQMQIVIEPGYPDYFRFGWFNTEEEDGAVLYFPEDPSDEGHVFGLNQGAYEMVFQLVSPPDTAVADRTYQVFLANRVNTALDGLQSTSHFQIFDGDFQYRPGNPELGVWFACQTIESGIELYFGHANGKLCDKSWDITLRPLYV